MILRVVTYITAGTILLLGIVVTSGYLIPVYVPANFRLMLGIVMILYGLFRIAMLAMRRRHARKLEE